MTEEQVNHFVDGCMSPYTLTLYPSGQANKPDYPSYELFTETLRDGVFKPSPGKQPRSDWRGRQLRLVVDKTRRVQGVVKI